MCAASWRHAVGLAAGTLLVLQGAVLVCCSIASRAGAPHSQATPSTGAPGRGEVTLLLAAHRAFALAWGLYTGGGLSPCPGRQRHEGSSLSTPAVSALLERRPGRWARCAACAGRCARWPPGAPCSCWCGARQAAGFVVAGLLGGQLANEGSVERRAQPPSACWRAALPRCRTFVDGLALRSGFYCGRQKP